MLVLVLELLVLALVLVPILIPVLVLVLILLVLVLALVRRKSAGRGITPATYYSQWPPVGHLSTGQGTLLT